MIKLTKTVSIQGDFISLVEGTNVITITDIDSGYKLLFHDNANYESDTKDISLDHLRDLMKNKEYRLYSEKRDTTYVFTINEDNSDWVEIRDTSIEKPWNMSLNDARTQWRELVHRFEFARIMPKQPK